jgi:hypothetical protein
MVQRRQKSGALSSAEDRKKGVAGVHVAMRLRGAGVPKPSYDLRGSRSWGVSRRSQAEHALGKDSGNASSQVSSGKDKKTAGAVESNSAFLQKKVELGDQGGATHSSEKSMERLQGPQYFSQASPPHGQYWHESSWYPVQDFPSYDAAYLQAEPLRTMRGSTSSQHINELIEKYSGAEVATTSWCLPYGPLAHQPGAVLDVGAAVVQGSSHSPPLPPQDKNGVLCETGENFGLNSRGKPQEGLSCPIDASVPPTEAKVIKSLGDQSLNGECYNLDWLLSEPVAECPIDQGGFCDDGKFDVDDWILDVPSANDSTVPWTKLSQVEHRNQSFARADTHGSSTGDDNSNSNTESYQPPHAELRDFEEVNNIHSEELKEQTGENNYVERMSPILEEEAVIDESMFEYGNDFDLLGEILDVLSDDKELLDPTSVQIHD